MSNCWQLFGKACRYRRKRFLCIDCQLLTMDKNQSSIPCRLDMDLQIFLVKYNQKVEKLRRKRRVLLFRHVSPSQMKNLEEVEFASAHPHFPVAHLRFLSTSHTDFGNRRSFKLQVSPKFNFFNNWVPLLCESSFTMHRPSISSKLGDLHFVTPPILPKP